MAGPDSNTQNQEQKSETPAAASPPVPERYIVNGQVYGSLAIGSKVRYDGDAIDASEFAPGEIERLSELKAIYKEGTRRPSKNAKPKDEFEDEDLDEDEEEDLDEDKEEDDDEPEVGEEEVPGKHMGRETMVSPALAARAERLTRQSK